MRLHITQKGGKKEYTSEQKMSISVDIRTSAHVEVVYMHICTHKSVNKGLLPLEGHAES